MAIYLGIWLFALFAALVTFWSRKQARLNAELKEQLEESHRRLAELQAHVQRAMDDVSSLSSRRDSLAEEEAERPIRGSMH